MFLVAIKEDSWPVAAGVLLYGSQSYKKAAGLLVTLIKSIFAVRIIPLMWYIV